MVNLMNVLVERTPMKRTMGPVMPGVLQHKEHSDLVSIKCLVLIDSGSQRRHFTRGTIQHCEKRRKRYAGRKADVLSHWVEEPDKVNEFLGALRTGLIQHTIFEAAQP